MAFVGPDKLVNSDNPPPSRQFIGPDQNLTVSVNNPPPEEGVVGSAVKAALAPFKGPDKLVNSITGIENPDLDSQISQAQAKAGGPMAFEKGPTFPSESFLESGNLETASNLAPFAPNLARMAVGPASEALSSLAPTVAKTATKAFVGPEEAIQPNLPGVPTATTSDVSQFANTAKPGDVFPVGGGNAVKFKGTQPGVPGVVPDQPIFDLQGANLPPEYAQKGDLSHTFVGPDRLAQEGIVNPVEPTRVYPATKTPDGGYNSGHTWAPYQKRVMQTSDPAEKAAIMNEAQNNVGFIDDTGRFYTVQEYADLRGAGQVQSVNTPRAGKLTPTEAPPSTGGTPITFSNQDITDINKATGMNIQPQLEQAELPKTAVKNPPIPPVPTDPIVKGFGDEMAMGKVQDRFVPGVSDMNRQFSLVATNPQTAATGALQQAKNSVTQAEVRIGQQYNNYLRALDKFGIAPGSKESEALFHYIEGNSSDVELIDQFGKKTAKNIKSEAAFMSDQYEQWLDEINEIRAGRGLKPITKRTNYINHMNEMSSVGEDLVSSIKGDADLAEKSQVAMAQADQYRMAEPDVAFRHIIRKGGVTAEDAVSSFRKYINDALNYRELAPEVDRLIQMSKLANANKMPNLAARLEDYAGYVANKPQLLDKYFADTVGKTTASLIQKLGRNITFSVISFNPAIWAAQTIRLFPKVMLEGAGTENILAGAKLFSSEARTAAWENVPFLQKMFLNREEAAITGGFGGSGPMQTIERVGANIPGYIDQSFAMHTALLSHDAKLAELTAKYPMSAASDLDKQAWLYAEHNIENYQALISKSATAPYFRSKTSKILTPLMREATLMTDFLYHDVLRNTGNMNRATQAARAFAGLSAMAVMGSVMEYAGGEEQKPLIGKALFPMLKALESGGSMVKTAAAPLTATKAFVEGKGTFGDIVKSSVKSVILARGTPGGLQVTKILDSLFGK